MPQDALSDPKVTKVKTYYLRKMHTKYESIIMNGS